MGNGGKECHYSMIGGRLLLVSVKALAYATGDHQDEQQRENLSSSKQLSIIPLKISTEVPSLSIFDGLNKDIY